MERVEIREIEPPISMGLQISAEPQLRALSEQYAARGLVKAVMNTAAEQVKNEEKTRELAPDAYRLSLLNDTVVTASYRRGKESMSSADLLRYFDETRNARIQNSDFTGNTGVDECTGSNVKEESFALVAQTGTARSALSEKVRELPATAGKKLRSALPTWFDSSTPDTSSDRKRFPLSAFAAMLAVTASLLLIVASSVLLRRAEANVSCLKTELSSVSSEVMELKTELEVQNDLLEIRRIATEEYGMVGEDYVKMDYISLRSEDSVEVYEEEREKSVGLSALLSAIGIK